MNSKNSFFLTIFRLLFAFGIAIIATLSLAVFSTWNSISFLKKQDFNRTEIWSSVAKPVVSIYRSFTGDKVAELVVWDQGLWLLKNSEDLTSSTKILADFQPATEEEKQQAHESMRLALVELEVLGQNLSKSSLFKLSNLPQESLVWLSIAQDVWQSDRPWLILFQNTEEARATGGFIGSYAEVWFTPKRLGEIEIHDIYDPTGLIFTQLKSPPGQEKYLSAGRGFRLPDANWDADFPSSAERILWFFSQIENDPQDYQGVVAVNLSLVEELIGVFGELQVPEIDQALTKENFSQLARQSRGDFFAGSREKTQFLDQAMVALRSRFNQLNSEEAGRLQSVLIEATQNKDLQLYSSELKIQENIKLLNATGEIKLPEENKDQTVFYVAPIESNVGINKANRLVTREFCYINKFEQIELTYVFHNDNLIKDRPTEEDLSKADYNLSPHLGYINYQRFLLSPADQIEEIVWDGQEIKDWDSRLITTYGDEVFKEIGFLLKLPEESSGRLTVIVAPGKMLDKNSEIVIEPQSGVEYLECADTIF